MICFPGPGHNIIHKRRLDVNTDEGPHRGSSHKSDTTMTCMCSYLSNTDNNNKNNNFTQTKKCTFKMFIA